MILLCQLNPDAYDRRWREVWPEDFLTRQMSQIVKYKYVLYTEQIKYKKANKALQGGLLRLIHYVNYINLFMVACLYL
jgi:hypothetical protein